MFWVYLSKDLARMSSLREWPSLRDWIGLKLRLRDNRLAVVKLPEMLQLKASSFSKLSIFCKVLMPSSVMWRLQEILRLLSDPMLAIHSQL